jgi:hypothetical protein
MHADGIRQVPEVGGFFPVRNHQLAYKAGNFMTGRAAVIFLGTLIVEVNNI